MTNSHDAWGHLVGAGNAILDIAADTSLKTHMRNKLTTINATAVATNRLTKREMALIGRALVALGENEPRDS